MAYITNRYTFEYIFHKTLFFNKLELVKIGVFSSFNQGSSYNVK